MISLIICSVIALETQNKLLCAYKLLMKVNEGNMLNLH